MIRIRIKGKNYSVKDCKGLSSVRGLMFDNLKDKDGALIHANSIWMPFVSQKLNLFFLDGNKKVLSMQKAVPLGLDPKTWKVYSDKKAKYCLEVKAK
jgi:uncharacterized membrane protein (UPF0127 family)